MKKCISVHNHLLNVIEREVPPKPSLNILDAGCGTLTFSKFLLENLDRGKYNVINVYGYEISEFYSLERLHSYIENDTFLKKSGIIKNINVIQMDNYVLPYNNNFFDLIISNQVVEHVSNLEEFYVEQKRILKDDGLIINCFPAKEIIVEPHLKIPFIHNIMNKKFGKNYLKFAYMLIGVKDENFINNRFSYIQTDTNYKSLFWHLNKLNDEKFKAISVYNLFFFFTKLLNIFKIYRKFKYIKLGKFEPIFAYFSSYFYSVTIIIRKAKTI